MSHFLSAVIKNNKIYYLTTKDIESGYGFDLLSWTGTMDDVRGHGFLREYLHIVGGKDIEYRNFYDPDNLPDSIVQDVLKAFVFYRWFGLPPTGILLPKIQIEYVNKAIKMMLMYYDKHIPNTFREYRYQMLNLQKESWLKILNPDNLSSKWNKKYWQRSRDGYE